MLNPFDLHGPAFLLFYLILSVVTYLLSEVFRLIGEPNDDQFPPLHDPYDIACLRGGLPEVTRLAVFSLLGRKFIEEKANGTLMRALGVTPENGMNEAEHTLLSILGEPCEPKELFAKDIGGGNFKKLQLAGLLPNEGQLQGRILVKVAAVIILVSVAVLKVSLAIQRGKRNVGFLILLCIAACTLIVLSRHPRTPRGNRAMRGLEGLFDALQWRVKTMSVRQVTDEMVFACAVFGVFALPEPLQNKMLRLFPRVDSFYGGGDSAAWTSSCGSSCGGSCGGGCGGGCGGCGS